MEEVLKEDSKKSKSKLKKSEIVQLIVATIGVLLIVTGIIFGTVKVPIEGTFYLTNTSVEERQQKWEDVYAEKKSYYDGADTSLYQNFYDEEVDRLYSYPTFTYVVANKSSIGEKFYVNCEISNKTTNAVTVKNVRVEVSGDESFFESNIGVTVSSNQKNIILVEISETAYTENELSNFRIKNISCSTEQLEDIPAVVYENQDYIERAKGIAINRQIESEIGFMPGSADEENVQTLYKIADNNFKTAFTILIVIGSFTFAVAIVVFICSRLNKFEKRFLFASPNETITTTKVIVVEHKDCDHKTENKIKKVVCAYCGSLYKETLDSCPKCGSSKIKEAKPEEKPKEESKEKTKK